MRILLLIMALAVSACSAGGSPAGWRPATKADVWWQIISQKIDRSSRPPADARQTLVADFDGDGREDRASLMVNSAKREVALWVFRQGAPPAQLGEAMPVSDLVNLGLYPHKPGVVASACAKGYGADDAPCRPQVVSRWPGISLVYFEASSTAYWWDGKTFETEALSD